MQIRWAALIFTAVVVLGTAVLMGSGTDSVTAQTEAARCAAIVRDALREVGSNCDRLSRNSACYGFDLVRGSFTQAVPAHFFTRPADRGELSIFERIQTFALNLQNKTWGIALMSLQANLPQTLPGQSVVFMLVGDTRVENAVAPDRAFVGGMVSPVVTRLPAALYIDPSTRAPLVANVPAGVTLQADAVTPEGDWVRVVYEGQPGWLMVTVIDAPNGLNLPVYTPQTRSPMQAFYFRTGIGTLDCFEAPSVLVVQGPQKLRVNINANGADMQLGSTVALNTLPVDPRTLRLLFPNYTGQEPVGALIQVTTLDGAALIYPGTDQEVIVRAGRTAISCLSENRSLGIDGIANDRRVIAGCGWVTRDLGPGELDSLVELEGFELLYPISLPPGTVSTMTSEPPPIDPPPATIIPPVTPTPTLPPTFVPSVSDLSLSKSVNNPNPSVGALVEFTITLTLLGPDSATGVVVTDLLPPGLVYASHSVSAGSYNAAAGVWTVGDVNVGGTYTLTLSATTAPNPPGTVLTNTAAVTAFDQTDPVGGNNSASASVTVAAAADLALSKTVDHTTPLEGETVVYTITVQNLGPNAAGGIIVNEPLASGLDYLSHTQTQGSYSPVTGIWDIGALGVGQSAALTITVEVLDDTGGTTITNTASITGSSPPDPASGNNSASATIEPINVPRADLSIIKQVDDDTPPSGGVVEYTITVYNSGSDPATGITVSDLLEPGQVLLTFTPSQGSYNPITGIWDVGALGDDDDAALTISAQITAPVSAIIHNTAAITASTPSDPDLSDNSASVILTVVALTTELGVSKTVDDDTPVETQLVTYTITMTHNSGDPVSGVQVNDPVPVGLTYAAHSASQGTYNSSTGIWDIGSLNPGDSVTLLLSVTVDVGTVGQTITNTAAIINSGWTDPISTNDQASADLVVQP